MKGKCLTRINYGENMGNNPAKVNIYSGEISVNPTIWNDLTDNEREIILTHEKGHFFNKSANEVVADNYLVKKYGKNSEKLIEIANTINKYVPDTEKNNYRKAKLCWNILEQNQKNNDAAPEANLWGEIIGAVLSIASVVAPSLLGNTNRSQWQKSNEATKNNLMYNAYFEAAYIIYRKNGGDWATLVSKSNITPDNSSSVLYQAWAILAKQGLFDNGSSEKDLIPSTFWQQNGIPQINTFKAAIQSRYANESIVTKFIYSTMGQIALAAFAAFILFQFLKPKK